VVTRALAVLFFFSFPLAVVAQTEKDAPSKAPQNFVGVLSKAQQVMISVELCELSLKKSQGVVLSVEGVDPDLLKKKTFGQALVDGDLHATRPADEFATTKPASKGIETHVINDDKTLKKVIADLQKAGALKLIASPRFVATHGRPTTLHSGGEVEVPLRQPNGEMGIERKPIGTQIEIESLVTDEDKIRLEVEFRYSEIDERLAVQEGETSVPGFRSFGIHTRIEMKSGDTWVMGGLRQRKAVDQAQTELGEIERIVLLRAEILPSP